MKKLSNRTTILVIINLFSALIFSFESFDVTNFINDSNTDLIGAAFFLTALGWNVTLMLDKKKEKLNQ
tara:strand:+ start:1168 stop:1371 length:204 start_codon:yes stop_codon:yes gene_type:complete